MNDQSFSESVSASANEPEGCGDDADVPEPIEVTWGCAVESSIEMDVLRRQLEAVCAEAGVAPVHFSVVIIDDERMAAMHVEFLGVAGTTDAITFDLRDEEAQGTDVEVEGEVYICLDEARRRATELGHALADELLLYATHGLLHLLGYDDHDAEDHRRMHAREDELLTAIGVGAIYGADREGRS